MAKPRETSVVTDVLPLRNGDRVIVQLEAVVEGSVSELSAEELTAVRSQLQRAVSVQSLNAYQAAVRDSAEITIR